MNTNISFSILIIIYLLKLLYDNLLLTVGPLYFDVTFRQRLIVSTEIHIVH